MHKRYGIRGPRPTPFWGSYWDIKRMVSVATTVARCVHCGVNVSKVNCLVSLSSSKQRSRKHNRSSKARHTPLHACPHPPILNVSAKGSVCSCFEHIRIPTLQLNLHVSSARLVMRMCKPHPALFTLIWYILLSDKDYHVVVEEINILREYVAWSNQLSTWGQNLL